MPKGIKQSLEERFWIHVDKTENCWKWVGSLSASGYGRIKDKGKLLRSHRVSWEIHNGPIPDGFFVCHSCDIRSCVRPDHLFLGTHQENMDDMKSKRRMKIPEQNRSGAASSRAKLTQEQVDKIRNRHYKEQLSSRV